jgi:signal peptidase I
MVRAMLKKAIAAVILLAMVAGCSRVEAAARGERMFRVPSASMEPTIQAGQKVKARPISDGGYRPKRGDVVVFDGSQIWQPGKNVLFIFRVIGIGGDHVTSLGGNAPVLVNGRALDEKAYLYSSDSPNDGEPFDLVVPAGRLWLMGDHRSVAADSRAHRSDPGEGTVETDRVLAVVVRTK